MVVDTVVSEVAGTAARAVIDTVASEAASEGAMDDEVAQPLSLHLLRTR